MQTFLKQILKGVKYSAQIARDKAYLRGDEIFVDQKSLSISSLQIDYFDLDNSVINKERANFSQSSCSCCVVSHPTERWFKQHRKD